MNMPTRLGTGLSIALAGASAAYAGSDRYEIAATLLHEGRAFATPAMTVRSGEPATVEVAGPDAYTLEVTATGIDAETVRIEASLESMHGSMQPVMVVRAGEPASVTVGDLGLEIEVAREGAAGSP